MPTCDKCSRKTNALHSGGDARIPSGDTGDGGYCGACEMEATVTARAVAEASRSARIAEAVAASGAHP